eukprot:Ihof_evm7s694 gene=Ihof_evmTU7s694
MIGMIRLFVLLCAAFAAVSASPLIGEMPGSLEPGSLEPGSLEPGSLEPGSLEPGSLEPGSSEKTFR